MARRHWSRTLFICSLPLVLAGGGACGDGSAIGTDDTSDVKDVLFPDVADTLVPDTLVPDTVAPDSVTPDTVSPDSELPDVADTDEPVDTEHPDVADTVDAADAADTADTSATPQVDWCRLQFPLDLTVGTATPVMVYGRVYVDGLTNLTTGNDLSASLVARVGRGGHGTDPATWTSWAVAAPNTAWDATAAGELHNDEYMATLPPAQTPGTYDFAYAFSYDGGQSWTYCDRDAGDGHDGSEDGYQSDNAGVMIVVPNPCVPNPCADPPTECVGAVLREYLEPGVCTDDGGAPACAYSDFIDTNCAEDGESCDPVALTCVETGCEPNPCTVGKAPTCDGDTVVSYALNGTCDESSGAVQCTYAEAARVTCDGAAPYCAAGACVAWRPAGVGDVVISEVMPQPNAVSDALGEWFELENVSADTVNLKGLQITNAAGGETFTVGADLVLAPGGVAVFGRSTDTAVNGGAPVDALMAPMTLANAGDSIHVWRDGTLVDAVAWTSSWPFAKGVAMSLPPSKATAADNDAAASWCKAYVAYGDGDLGTPGVKNGVCKLEIGWCRLQFPTAITVAPSATFDVYAHLFVEGLTNLDAGANPHPLLRAEVGRGASGSQPSGWTGWVTAAPNPAFDAGGEPSNDEYMAPLTAPATAGSYDFAYRFSGDRGATWVYCDRDAGAGSDGSADGYQPANAGKLTVSTAGPCSPNPCTTPPAACVGDVLHAYATPGTCAVVGAMGECSYDETGTTDCTATGKVCDEGTRACVTPASACVPNPCTAVPAATCDGNDLLTYAAVCDDGTGEAACSYPVTRTTCPAEAPVCSAGACVAARLAGVGDLVITEVMADPEAVADDVGEWFEVKNVAAVAVNLKGLKFQDGSATVTTVTNDLVVQPGGYALFVRTADTATNGGLTADATFAFALNNGSTADVITITRGADLIDAADFRSTAMGLAFPKGASYQLDPDKTTAADNDVAANWCVGTTPISATNTDKGTPRADNTACGGAAQCEPNPCTTPTAATCTGDTYQSYASPGTCTPGASTPTCEYAPNAPVDCSATGGRCSAADGGCVACLDNDDCGVPFEACDIGTHACVAACIDDGYEGNDSLASAVVLTTDIMATDLVICSDNGDFFAMDLIAGQKVDALIEFDPSMADLSLTLYDPMGAVVATSDTGADFEELTYTPATAGRYVLAVTAPVGEQALYDLTLTFAPDACTGVVCNTPPSGCASGSYQSYQTPGSCAVVDGHADCSYVANTPVDCGALGQVCSDADGGCVGCLATSDCDVPFEVCDTGAHACVAQCTDDGYEPNDSVGAPAVLTADLLATDLVLCADNDDYYALDMLSGQDIDALMELDSAAGVLDLALLDPAGDVVATSLADGDSASLSYTTTEAGRWTLRVSAAAGVRNVYDLTVLWYVAACAPNPCTNPAAPYCAGTHLITEPATGACAETGSGAYTCDYASGATDTACDAFCNAGACTTWRPVSVAGDLVVSEIMARPTAADGQYVELYNASGVALNLNGVTVYDITAGDELVIGADLIVEAGAYVVLGESADTGANGGVAVDYVWSGFTLDPTEDEVALAALDGTDIDDVMYDASWPFTAGVALGFDPTLVGGASAVTDNDAPANWCGATSTIANGDHGTPGAANDACLAPLTFGFCRLQYPPSMAVVTGGEATVYGRLYVATLTTENEFSNDPDARVLGQVGYGPTGSQPTEASWTWAAGSPNDGYGPPGAEANNDEYVATLTAPVTVGTYDYAFRFSVDGGATWHACDQDGVTGDGNLTYDPAQAGVLTVTPPKLLITEYVEGSSNNKALEVTNLGESPLDLAALGCEFRFYNAPGDSPPHSTTISNAVALTTTLDPRASWVVCDDESSATVLSLCDQPDNDSFFNGDDPVELACGGQVIDSVGRRGITTNFGKDVTFHRKCTVSEGDGVSDDAFDPAVEWDALPKDTFSGLGSHAPVLQPTVTGVAGKALVIDAIDLLSTPRRVRVRNVSAGAVTITPDWRWAQDPTFAPVVGADAVIAAGAATVFELPVAYSFAPGSTFELGLYASSDFDAPTALAAYVEANAAWQPREGVAVSAALWTAGGFAPAPAGIGGLVLVPSAAIGTPAAYTTYGDQCRL